MAHYIDAYRLKAEIKKRYNEMLNRAKIDANNATYWNGKADSYRSIYDLIDSLQQEQPEGLHFTPLNRLIQKIPSENWNDTVNNYAKKLRDCLIKEGYRKDAEVLQGYISYMNGNNVPMATMDEQEQPIQINTLTWKDINELESIINSVHYEFRNGIGAKSFGEEVLERFREARDEQEQPQVADTSKMEQPEVDLKKFISDFIDKKDTENYGRWCEDDIIEAMKESFYLGLNTRKEK